MRPAAMADTGGTIRIVGFDPRWRADFARLNIEWLQRWFVVEPFDEEVLGELRLCCLATCLRLGLPALRRRQGRSLGLCGF